MKKFLCIFILLLLALVGSASAYNINLNCSPLTIPVGQTIKCSIDSNFPAGTSFNLNFYQKQYTATLISSQPMTIQPNQLTQYALFDTTGLKGGQDDVEIAWNGVVAIGSDSVTTQSITMTDRSGDLTITSPTTQNLADALVIAVSSRTGEIVASKFRSMVHPLDRSSAPCILEQPLISRPVTAILGKLWL